MVAIARVERPIGSTSAVTTNGIASELSLISMLKVR